ncbi:MAG TPA: sensor histidine kinase [Leucothrix sp.]|nr:sensor histidine kinase [Leucothrix sp.]
MTKTYSLKRELNRWIISTALVFVLVAGALSGWIVFKQAREQQDQTLLEIGMLIKSGKLKESISLHHDINENTVIINELGEIQHIPIVPVKTTDGFHTMMLDGSQWRVLITTQSDSQRRFSIAQQTKQRDAIARSSSLSVLFPIIVLVGLMLLMINYIIKRQFRSLAKLTKELEQQEANKLFKLDAKNVPEEISPFVNSINSLLSRVSKTVQKQQRFIADAAHELRTPIAALSLQVDNLNKQLDHVERDERQKDLHKGLSRLRILVNQLLNLARLQSEDNTTNTKIIFNPLVHQAIESLFPLLEKSDIDLGIIKQDENLKVYDQQDRLSQLVYNSIDNAIRYSPKGGKIDISLYQDQDDLVYLVEDQGIGIPEEQLKQVMQPFYRVQECEQLGNGLGLAISQEIAQLLDGHIELSNRKNGGLRFSYRQKLFG